MPGATVKEFDPTRGFGTLTLDTGEEIPFDISVTNSREPRPDDRAEVTLAPGWKGQLKATLVVFERVADRAPTFAGAVEQLRALGFLRHWDVEDARAAARTMWDDGVPATLVRGDAGMLLHRYYGESERARSEGVLTLDRRFHLVTREWLDEVGALGGEGVAVKGDSLALVLASANAMAAARNATNRLFSVDFGRDFYVIASPPSDFESRIATTAWLTLYPRVEVVDDKRR